MQAKLRSSKNVGLPKYANTAALRRQTDFATDTSSRLHRNGRPPFAQTVQKTASTVQSQSSEEAAAQMAQRRTAVEKMYTGLGTM